ncbi:MAG: hypothetical protein HZB26_05590 [Candidatus Hydrogenedentes bacterium]|nr:hypothetical protein [Candidatus Hydrogenedentota bacterium]
MRGKRQFWIKIVAISAISFAALRCTPALTGVLINDGEAATNTRQVVLRLDVSALRASDSPTQYKASESKSFTGAVWQTYTSPNVNFTLSAGNGLKTVYVKLRNAAAQESLVRSDTIYLAETTPAKWMRAVDMSLNSSDEGYGIASTGDGAYVAGGLTIPSGGDGTSQVALVKLTANGAPTAIETFGDPTHNEILNVVRQTLDGGIIAAGGIYDGGTGNTHVFATKYTRNLDPVWFDTYPLGDLPADPPAKSGSALTSYAADVLVLASGGYIVAGTQGYNAIDASTGNMFLLRLDGDGNQVDFRTYSEAGAVRLGNGVAETNDGGLILAGQRIQGGVSQAYLIKVVASLTNRTTDLSVLWSKAVYGDLASAIVPAPDGGVVYCGFTAVGHDNLNDSFVARVTLDGVQDNAFGQAFGGGGVDRLTALAQDSDGGYVLAGSSSSYAKGSQAYLVKTDPQGMLVFFDTYGDTNTDDAKSVAVAPDGGYAMAGFTETGAGPREGDFFVVKTDSLGHTGTSIQP